MTESQRAEYEVAAVKPKSRVKLIISLVVVLIIVPPIFYVALIIFVAQPVKVQGAAMSPTLNDGDRIFVWKHFSSIKRATS